MLETLLLPAWFIWFLLSASSCPPDWVLAQIYGSRAMESVVWFFGFRFRECSSLTGGRRLVLKVSQINL